MKRKNYTYLIGKARIEIKDKFGYGLNYFASDLWTYKLGKTWIGRRITLSIIFKDEEVVEIKLIKRFWKK